MANEILSSERVRELLDYDPETGVFVRKVRMAQAHQVGDRADLPGHGNLKGYRTIGLFNKKYLAHRVAWLYVYGEWPEQHIDHINGERGDNRIANLRDVPLKVNTQNKRSPMPSNKSGLLGAVWYPQNQKFRARIQVGKKFIHIGMFYTAEAAHEAYVRAKRKYHEGCTI
jgi:hypothetical protein